MIEQLPDDEKSSISELNIKITTEKALIRLNMNMDLKKKGTRLFLIGIVVFLFSLLGFSPTWMHNFFMTFLNILKTVTP